MALTLTPTKTQAIIKSSDQNDNSNTTTISNMNPALTQSTDKTGYTKINTAMRGLIALTTDTYKDTDIVNTYSLEQIINENI